MSVTRPLDLDWVVRQALRGAPAHERSEVLSVLESADVRSTSSLRSALHHDALHALDAELLHQLDAVLAAHSRVEVRTIEDVLLEINERKAKPYASSGWLESQAGKLNQAGLDTPRKLRAMLETGDLNQTLQDKGIKLYYNDDTIRLLKYVCCVGANARADSPAPEKVSAAPPAPQPSKARVSVVVRPRRIFEHERPSRRLSIGAKGIQYSVDEDSQLANGPADHFYTFDDGVFQPDTNPSLVYAQDVQPLVHHVTSGWSATCCCYGQTGSGKSYTMGSGNVHQRGKAVGLIALAVQDIFADLLKLAPAPCWNVHVTCIQVYNEQIEDLLAEDGERLHVRYDVEGTPVIPNISEHNVKSAHEANRLIAQAVDRRTTQATEKNATSSRSHALFMIKVQRPVLDFESAAAKPGTLTFVDLAGTEELQSSGDPSLWNEGVMIHQSLNALRKCVDAVNKGHSSVPYRASVLTLLLKPSLNGTSRLLFVLCMSPSEADDEETLNTLNYGESMQHMNALERDALLNQDEKFELTARLEALFGDSPAQPTAGQVGLFRGGAAASAPAPFRPTAPVAPFAPGSEHVPQPFHAPGPQPHRVSAWASTFSRPFKAAGISGFRAKPATLAPPSGVPVAAPNEDLR